MVELRALGVLEVRADGGNGDPASLTQPRRLALLLYLALAEPAGLHARDRLLALFWPDADAASARHSLRNALHALRRALGEDAVVTRGDAFVGLDHARLRCDALTLRAHLAAGRTAEAVQAWTGELAPGFHVSGAPDFEHWLDQQRDELRRAVRAAAWRDADRCRGTGADEVEAVRRAVRLDPASEVGTRRLMQLLAESGDRAGALRAYRALTDHLARELDTAPSPATRALADAQRIAASTGGVAPARPSPAPTPAPVAAAPDPVTTPLEIAAARSAPRRRPPRAVLAVAALVLASGLLLARRPAPAAPPRTDAERAILRVPARYRADTAAFASYLRGVTLRTRFAFLASRDTLAALVDRAPLYVPGLCELAHAWIFVALNGLSDPDDAWAKVEALTQRALALDSTAASAWLALASRDMFRRLDFPRAREHIDRAGVLDPGDPDVAGMRSVWFRVHGQMDSALAESARARRLDPLNLHLARLHVRQLFLARRYDAAWEALQRLFEDDPAWKRGLTDAARLLVVMERPREAVAWYRRARFAEGDSLGAARLVPAATDAEARARLDDDARHRLARLDAQTRAGARVGPSAFAGELARLRDTAATLDWLDSIVVHHDPYLHQVRLDPAFDFVRAHPRYADWERRTGLPPLAPGAPGQPSRPQATAP